MSGAKWKCPWCPTLVRDKHDFARHASMTHHGRWKAEPDAEPVEWYTKPPARVRPMKELPGQGQLFEFGGHEHMED